MRDAQENIEVLSDHRTLKPSSAVIGLKGPHGFIPSTGEIFSLLGVPPLLLCVFDLPPSALRYRTVLFHSA